MKILLPLLFLCFFLGACGLKGPLQSPEKHTAKLMFTSTLFYRVT